MIRLPLISVALISILLMPLHAGNALVLMSDFGTEDGAVAAMRGVAFTVSDKLAIFDLTHQIPPYDIWNGAYRLVQAAPYWPAGTVFVAVVDPGVGTDRRSVVLQTHSGHFFVSPDNGTLTLVAETLGIAAVRQIDEAVNRRRDSSASYTFHGRDVYAYTGARLAAGAIRFEEVGAALPATVVKIPYQQAALSDSMVVGNIPVLDVRYGNVWTNIPRAMIDSWGAARGDTLQVRIFRTDHLQYHAALPLVNTFGDVPVGHPLLYFNSLDHLSVALNMDSFAAVNHISAGGEWRITILRRP